MTESRGYTEQHKLKSCKFTNISSLALVVSILVGIGIALMFGNMPSMHNPLEAERSSRFFLQQSQYDLDAEADDLGWVPSYAPSSVSKQLPGDNRYASITTSSRAALQRPETQIEPSKSAARTQYLVLGQDLKNNLAGVVNSLSADEQQPLGQQPSAGDMKAILKALAEYAPLAAQAQEDLNDALAARRRAARERLQARKETQLQYGREVRSVQYTACIHRK